LGVTSPAGKKLLSHRASSGIGNGEGVDNIDDNLKQLMKELGTAINDTLSSSERISEAIAKIRASGYDVFLVLEATIGFNKRQEDGTAEAGFAKDAEGETKLHITSQDVKFLKSLKISIDEKEME
jgi:predicted transcriptional regulator